ncbi:MAG: hypothetical protein AAFZ15_02425 [Bacteroidota bacterium]
MKTFFFVPVFFLMLLGITTDSSNFNATEISDIKVEIDENEIIDAFTCNPYVTVTYNTSTPPGYCNTCSNCGSGCESSSNRCRGVLVTAKVNWSSTLPAGWNLQWTVPGGEACSISNSWTLSPTVGFDVCKASGTGSQTVTLRLVLLPPWPCTPITKDTNITYTVC